MKSETWQPIEAGIGPAARYNHQVIWTSEGLIVFGGRDNGPLANMRKYFHIQNKMATEFFSQPGHPGIKISRDPRGILPLATR